MKNKTLIELGIGALVLVGLTTIPASANAQNHNGKYEPPLKQSQRSKEKAVQNWKQTKDQRERQRRDREDKNYDLYKNDSKYARRTINAVDHNDWNEISRRFGDIKWNSHLSKDRYFFFNGKSGDLYGYDRFDRDKKSKDKTDRLRAAYFSQPYFVRNGKRFDRVTVNRDGKHFYQFIQK